MINDRARTGGNDLTGAERTRLNEIAATSKTLYRAYLLKEQLREVFRGQKHPEIALLTRGGPCPSLPGRAT